MHLYHRDFGGKSKEPIILLHGLLGSSRNWVTVSRLLADHFHVLALDLRNHGQSPHQLEMTYELMVGDVCHWMDKHGLNNAHFIGHSMGGKVAMLLACTQPKRVKSLTIADIAPKPYSTHFQIAFDGMNQIVPSEFKRIAEVEKALAAHIDDSTLRQFLVTNLIRNESGTFDWQINLAGITKSLSDLSKNPIQRSMNYKGISQLLYGANSDFVSPEDWPIIQEHFPNCQLIKVPAAGHNIHIDNRQFFADQIIKYS